MTDTRIALLLVVLAIACVTDLMQRRIPNPLIVAGLVAALALAMLEDGVLGVGTSLLGATVGLAVLLPAFVLRLVGAGDAKLLGVVGAFTGAQALGWVALYTFLAGGVLAAGVLLSTGRGRESLRNLRLLVIGLIWLPAGGTSVISDIGRHSAARLPYAIAIAAGSMAWLLAGPLR